MHSAGTARRKTSWFWAAARATLSYLAKWYPTRMMVLVQDHVQQHASAWPGLAAIWMGASSWRCPRGRRANAQPEWMQVRHSACQQRCGGAAGCNRGTVPWHCTSVNLQIYYKCLEVPLLCVEGAQASRMPHGAHVRDRCTKHCPWCLLLGAPARAPMWPHDLVDCTNACTHAASLSPCPAPQGHPG